MKIGDKIIYNSKEKACFPILDHSKRKWIYLHYGEEFIFAGISYSTTTYKLIRVKDGAEIRALEEYFKAYFDLKNFYMVIDL